MKVKKYLHIIMLAGLVFLTQSVSCAQDAESRNTADSTIKAALPSLSETYYSQDVTLTRNYDFEAMNKVKKLRKQSNDVMTLGFVTFMTVIYGSSVLTVNNDWNQWISIPSTVVISMASIIPFGIWRNHLSAKADAIEAELKANSAVSADISIGMMKAPAQVGTQDVGYGLNITLNF